MKTIYRDYKLSETGVLMKTLTERKHLMWRFGGCPCLDAHFVWDKYKNLIRKIEFKTDKGRTFEISKEDFDANKVRFNDGYGEQYRVDKKLWAISSPLKEEIKLKQKVLL